MTEHTYAHAHRNGSKRKDFRPINSLREHSEDVLAGESRRRRQRRERG